MRTMIIRLKNAINKNLLLLLIKTLNLDKAYSVDQDQNWQGSIFKRNYCV